MQSLRMGMLVVAAMIGAIDASPRDQYDALVKEFDTARKAADDALAKAADGPERSTASGRRPQPNQFAPRFLALAENHPDDPAALDALIWVVKRCYFVAEAEKALGMIARDHARSERLKDFCGECSRYGQPFPAYEEMLRAVLKSNPHRDVQGATCLALADHLMVSKEKTESDLIRISIEREHPPTSAFGAPESIVKKTADRGLDKLAAESEALYQKVIDEYADLRLENNYPALAGEFAKGRLFVLRNLSIGTKAPEITGNDIYGKPMKLSDHRGKVVVLDFGSHRSCGVCRQYYPSLRMMVENRKDQPFVLLGISVEDDVKELRALAEKGETTWPIWWDGENMEGPLASQWVIRSMPTFYVLDHAGVIRNKGFIQPGEIDATVDMLMKERRASEATSTPGASPKQPGTQRN